MKVLIIGGIAGGATAAARLRRLDEKAEIVVIERDEYVSFANCGMPYYVGGVIEGKSDLLLQTPEGFKERYNVDVRVKNEALRIDRARKVVEIKDRVSGNVYEESYDKLILSPGAVPVGDKIPGADSDRVFTLRNIPDTVAIKEFIDNNKPASVAVLGGGAIGVEMAENFNRLGLDVTIIELANQIIAPVDFDMACVVQKHIRAKGVKLVLGNGVRAIKDDGSKLTIELDDGELTADMLLLSVGVRPESGLAKDCGLDINERGFIVTDDRMLTSDPDIYAVGDAIEITEFVSRERSAVALAGPANKQGRIAADNICGAEASYSGTQGSSIMKAFDLTVASTGLNEKTAARFGVAYEKSFTVSPSHAGYYPGAESLIVKTLFDPASGKILGAQIIGAEGADKRCDVIAAAIRLGATAHDLAELELCYAPPYGSAKDPVNMAGFVIDNILTGKMKIYHWHDIEKLDPSKVTLLDVRTGGECARGMIPGYVNIPVDELRDRLDEIDKEKPVYVTCQIGLRAYIACRILMQNGFDAFDLSGGYTVWKAVNGNK